MCGGQPLEYTQQIAWNIREIYAHVDICRQKNEAWAFLVQCRSLWNNWLLMCNTYIRTCILICNIYAICKWVVFCAHTPLVFQAINFTLQSSLRHIDFGLVVNEIIFYNCLVSERWTTLTASAHSRVLLLFTLQLICLFQLLILYKSVQLPLVSSWVSVQN